MTWSQKIIREKKKYSILHIEIVIVKMTNWLLFEKLLKTFKMKKYERFIKNCILRQCFNCQKYDHIDKHYRIAIVCDTCAKEHRMSDCDFNIIDKYKRCDACENREHIAWASNCKIKIQKKKNRFDTSHQNEIVLRRKIANDSRNFQVRCRKIHRIKNVLSWMKNDRFEKEKNCCKFKIKNVFRIIFDINANRKKQQHDEFARQKLVNERRNHKFEEHEKNIVA
jgi:hypothetical protein